MPEWLDGNEGALLTSVMVLVVALTVGMAVRTVVFRALQRWTRGTKSSVDDLILGAARGPSALLADRRRENAPSRPLRALSPGCLDRRSRCRAPGSRDLHHLSLRSRDRRLHQRGVHRGSPRRRGGRPRDPFTEHRSLHGGVDREIGENMSIGATYVHKREAAIFSAGPTSVASTAPKR